MVRIITEQASSPYLPFSNLICFCFLSQKKVVEIRDQLKRIARRLGITLKSCDGDMEVRNCSTLLHLKKGCMFLTLHCFRLWEKLWLQVFLPMHAV